MLRKFTNSRKALGKATVFDDYWAGKHLKSERTWLVEDLQDLAAEKSIRVTILR